MSNSKCTQVQNKKKKRKKEKRRFLFSLKKCWVIEDKLLPLYSHLVDGYTNQLFEDPFCCELIQVKQEPEDDHLLEPLPSVDQHDSSNHLEKVIDCCIYSSHILNSLEESKRLLTTQRQNPNNSLVTYVIPGTTLEQ